MFRSYHRLLGSIGLRGKASAWPKILPARRSIAVMRLGIGNRLGENQERLSKCEHD
jgi:hypothetical protein